VSVFGRPSMLRLWVRPDDWPRWASRSGYHRCLQQQNTVNPPAPSAASRSLRGRNSAAPCARKAAWRPGAIRRDRPARRTRRRHRSGERRCPGRTGRAELRPAGAAERKTLRLIALYQLPNSNAVEAADGVKRLMETLKRSFPPDLDYVIALDTTRAVTEGIKEIRETLFEALALVIVVVFIFLQGWRATLIPLLAGRCRWWAPSPCSHCWVFHQHALALRLVWPSGWWWTTPSSSLRSWNIISNMDFLQGSGAERNAGSHRAGHRTAVI